MRIYGIQDYQVRICHTGLSSEDMSYGTIRSGYVIGDYQVRICHTGLSSEDMSYGTIK